MAERPFEVLYNDGEGVRISDFNDEQRIMKTLLLDHLQWDNYRALTSSNDVGVASTELWSIGSSCMPYGSGALNVKNKQGVLFGPTNAASTWSASAKAEEMGLVVLDDGEIDQAITAAHATLDRIDRISVKFDTFVEDDTDARHFKDATTGALSSITPAKRRHRDFSYTYTLGTPGATPAPPAVPSGEQLWCDVVVPALAVNTPNGVGHSASQAYVIDHRWPFFMHTARALAYQGVAGLDAGGGYSRFSNDADQFFAMTSTGSGDEFYIMCPEMMGAAGDVRCLGVEIDSDDFSGGGVDSVELVYMRGTRTGYAPLVLADISASITGGVNAHSFKAGGDTEGAFWSQGYTTPTAENLANLAIKFTAGAASRRIGNVNWVMAGGYRF